MLGQIDGTAVRTVEGLRGADGAPHPVQHALAEVDATQCGFCTPGFVMSACRARMRRRGADARRDPRCAGRQSLPLHRLPADRRGDVTVCDRTTELSRAPRRCRRRRAARRFSGRRHLLRAALAGRPCSRCCAATSRRAAAGRRHRSRPAGQPARAAPADGHLSRAACRSCRRIDADADAASRSAPPPPMRGCCRCWSAALPPLAAICAGSARGRSARWARSAAIIGTPRRSATCRRCCWRSAPTLKLASARRARRCRSRISSSATARPRWRRTRSSRAIHRAAPAAAARCFACDKVSQAARPGHLHRRGAFAVAIKDGRIEEARLAFGGMAATPKRARGTPRRR